MKKLQTLALLLTFFFVSCKKDWQCECKVGNVVVDVVTIKDVGRMGAKGTCESFEEQNNAGGANQTCTLK